jgi:hypothetical protein
MKKVLTFAKAQPSSGNTAAKQAARTETIICDTYCDVEYAEDCHNDIEENTVVVTCGWVIIGTYCYSVCYDDGSGNGDGGGTDPNQGQETAFDNRITNNLVHPCLTSVFNGIKNISSGKIGSIINTFSGEVPGYSWNVTEGTNAGGNPGATDDAVLNGSVTTTFDSTTLQRYTDLAVARTMIHEAVHAYLVSYFSNDYTEFGKDYPTLLNDYFNKKYPDDSQAQHEEMGRDFVSQIGAALKQYGEANGYTLDDQVYNDIAWGGLYGSAYGGSATSDTQAFLSLLPGDKERIRSRNSAENSSTPNLDASPAGHKACP